MLKLSMSRPPTPFGEKCGTAAGYAVHQWHNEEICQPCRTAYNQKSKERMKERNARLTAQDKERIKLTHARWYEKNKEKVLKKGKKWREQNHDKVISKKAKRRSVISESYSIQQVLERYGTDCHICHKPINLKAPRRAGSKGWELSLHIDHVIPLAKGGTNLLENVKPAHGKCNLRKSANV